MKKQSIKVLLIAFCLSIFAIAPIFSGNSFNDNVSTYSAQYIEFLNTDDKSKYGDVVPMQYSSDYDSSDPYVEATTLESYYCLRDYYQIYTKNQDKFGLCWAYACTTSLETLLAIHYNEFYDFSPAWAGLGVYYLWNTDSSSGVGYKDYELGGGGNVNFFQTATEECGLMLHTDFDLTNLNRIDASNFETIYNEYKEKTIDIGVEYSRVSFSNKSSKFYKQVKTHIKENGSLYASCYSSDINRNTYTLCSKTGSSTHAISIIGWDDDFQASDWENPGAWIALNSWGDNWGYDGVFYISYDDVVVNTNMYGFKISSTNKIEITSNSNTPISNHYVGKYSDNATKNAYGSVYDKNIFRSGEDISITYKFTNFPNPTFTVFKEDVDLTSDFTVSENSNGQISISAFSLSPGTYKLKFTSSKGQNITKEIVVINGLELGSVSYYSSNTNISSYTGTPLYFDDYNSYNKENVHFEIFTNYSANFKIYLPSFSTLTSVDCIASDNVQSYLINRNSLSFATRTKFASGLINFTMYTTDGNATATLRLKSIDGETKDLYFTLIFIPNVSSIQNSLKFVYVVADYDGATSNRDIPKLKAVSNYNNAYIPEPTKGAYEFDGWYFDKEFYYPLSYDSNGYYLFFNNRFIDCDGTDNYYQGTFSYIYIYAKWREPSVVSVTFEFDNQTQTQIIPINSSAEIPDQFNLDVPGYEMVWDKSLENITNNIVITGKLKLTNPDVSKINIDGNDSEHLFSTYAKDLAHTIIVYPSHAKANYLAYSYQWFYSASENGVYSSLNKADNSLSVNKVKESGYYKLQVSASDTFAPNVQSSSSLDTTATIVTNPINVEIEKAETIINTFGITTYFTYNGKYQSIEEAATISRNEENENILSYEDNSFKDVGTGTHVVTIKAQETENYKAGEAKVNVTILPANVTIKVHNKRSALFSETVKLSYEVRTGSTVYSGDDLKIEYVTGINALSAGKYTISAKSLNNNYNVNVINGEYEVYYESLSVVLIAVIMVVLAALLTVLTYFIVTKIIISSYLRDSKIDKEINNL